VKSVSGSPAVPTMNPVAANKRVLLAQLVDAVPVTAARERG
jgi:hypothetical protein